MFVTQVSVIIVCDHVAVGLVVPNNLSAAVQQLLGRHGSYLIP